MNKDYDVKCKIDHGELYLSITHNGYQWTSVAIKDREREIPLIISELQRHLIRHLSGRSVSGVCLKCGCFMANSHYEYCVEINPPVA